MRNNKRTLLQRIFFIHPEKPSVFSLLVHIIESVFTGGIFLILLFGCAIILYFHYNNFETGNLLAALLGIVTLLAFYRGCAAWQQDLENIRRRKVMMRNGSQRRA